MAKLHVKHLPFMLESKSLILNHRYNDDFWSYTYTKKFPLPLHLQQTILYKVHRVSETLLWDSWCLKKACSVLVFWESEDLWSAAGSDWCVPSSLVFILSCWTIETEEMWPEGHFSSTMVLPQIWPRPCLGTPVGGFYWNEWDCSMYNSWYKNLAVFQIARACPNTTQSGSLLYTSCCLL